MSSRDAILGRLRAAGVKPPEDEKLIEPRDIDLFHDHPGKVNTCYVDTFVTRLTALKGEVHRVADRAAAAAVLRELVEDLPPEQILAQDSPLVRDVLGDHPIGSACRWDSDGLPANPELAACAVGITVADFLIARTGSILLRNRSAGGRRLSVVPPLHLVIATEDQVLASLRDGLNHLIPAAPAPNAAPRADADADADSPRPSTPALSDDWSYGVLISGPSRTADIEKILVLGAHGPKRLVVLLLPARGPLEVSPESKHAKDRDPS